MVGNSCLTTEEFRFALQELELIPWELISVEILQKIMRELDPDFRGYIALPVLTRIVARLPRDLPFYDCSLEGNWGGRGHGASGKGYSGTGSNTNQMLTGSNNNGSRNSLSLVRPKTSDGVSRRMNRGGMSKSEGCLSGADFWQPARMNLTNETNALLNSTGNHNLTDNIDNNSNLTAQQIQIQNQAEAEAALEIENCALGGGHYPRYLRPSSASSAASSTFAPGGSQIQTWHQRDLLDSRNLDRVNQRGPGGRSSANNAASILVDPVSIGEPRNLAEVNPHTTLNWDRCKVEFASQSGEVNGNENENLQTTNHSDVKLNNKEVESPLKSAPPDSNFDDSPSHSEAQGPVVKDFPSHRQPPIGSPKAERSVCEEFFEGRVSDKNEGALGGLGVLGQLAPAELQAQLVPPNSNTLGPITVTAPPGAEFGPAGGLKHSLTSITGPGSSGTSNLKNQQLKHSNTTMTTVDSNKKAVKEPVYNLLSEKGEKGEKGAANTIATESDTERAIRRSVQDSIGDGGEKLKDGELEKGAESFSKLSKKMKEERARRQQDEGESIIRAGDRYFVND